MIATMWPVHRPRWFTRAARRVAARRPAGDRGSSIIELAIVTPIVIALLLTMVALGRYSENKILVEQASAAAARAASLTSSPGRPGRRRRPPRRTPCPGRVWPARRCPPSVDTAAFRPGGQVSVTVTCTADLSQLGVDRRARLVEPDLHLDGAARGVQTVRGRFMNRTTEDPAAPRRRRRRFRS